MPESGAYRQAFKLCMANRRGAALHRKKAARGIARYFGDLLGKTRRAYAGVVYRNWTVWVMGLLVLSGGGLAFAAKAKPHYAALGAARSVPYSAEDDPAGARPGETKLKVRPLVVDGKVKGWTTGEIHEVTPYTFTVRSALRVN